MISTQENEHASHFDELIKIRDLLLFRIKANLKLISMAQERTKYYISNRKNYNIITEFLNDDRRRMEEYAEENKIFYTRLNLILNHIKLYVEDIDVSTLGDDEDEKAIMPAESIEDLNIIELSNNLILYTKIINTTTYNSPYGLDIRPYEANIIRNEINYITRTIKDKQNKLKIKLEIETNKLNIKQLEKEIKYKDKTFIKDISTSYYNQLKEYIENKKSKSDLTNKDILYNYKFLEDAFNMFNYMFNNSLENIEKLENTPITEKLIIDEDESNIKTYDNESESDESEADEMVLDIKEEYESESDDSEDNESNEDENESEIILTINEDDNNPYYIDGDGCVDCLFCENRFKINTSWTTNLNFIEHHECSSCKKLICHNHELYEYKGDQLCIMCLYRDEYKKNYKRAIETKTPKELKQEFLNICSNNIKNITKPKKYFKIKSELSKDLEFIIKDIYGSKSFINTA